MGKKRKCQSRRNARKRRLANYKNRRNNVEVVERTCARESKTSKLSSIVERGSIVNIQDKINEKTKGTSRKRVGKRATEVPIERPAKSLARRFPKSPLENPGKRNSSGGGFSCGGIVGGGGILTWRIYGTKKSSARMLKHGLKINKRAMRNIHIAVKTIEHKECQKEHCKVSHP